MSEDNLLARGLKPDRPQIRYVAFEGGPWHGRVENVEMLNDNLPPYLHVIPPVPVDRPNDVTAVQQALMDVQTEVYELKARRDVATGATWPVYCHVRPTEPWKGSENREGCSTRG